MESAWLCYVVALRLGVPMQELHWTEKDCIQLLQVGTCRTTEQWNHCSIHEESNCVFLSKHLVILVQILSLSWSTVVKNSDSENYSQTLFTLKLCHLSFVLQFQIWPQCFKSVHKINIIMVVLNYKNVGFISVCLFYFLCFI